MTAYPTHSLACHRVDEEDPAPPGVLTSRDSGMGQLSLRNSTGLSIQGGDSAAPEGTLLLCTKILPEGILRITANSWAVSWGTSFLINTYH